LYLQEYCDVGTLDSVVSGWEGEAESDSRMLQRLLLLKDVAAGLQVLHASNVVHGDLVRVEATPCCAAVDCPWSDARCMQCERLWRRMSSNRYF
jgi:serine/threonine protein kinase